MNLGLYHPRVRFTDLLGVLRRFLARPLELELGTRMIAAAVAFSYARSRRTSLAFSKTSRLLSPQGLRPLWYLKSIQ